MANNEPGCEECQGDHLRMVRDSRHRWHCPDCKATYERCHWCGERFVPDASYDGWPRCSECKGN